MQFPVSHGNPQLKEARNYALSLDVSGMRLTRIDCLDGEKAAVVVSPLTSSTNGRAERCCLLPGGGSGQTDPYRSTARAAVGGDITKGVERKPRNKSKKGSYLGRGC